MLARCRVHEVSQEWGCEWGSSYMNESIHSVSSHDCRFLPSRMRGCSLLITLSELTPNSAKIAYVQAATSDSCMNKAASQAVQSVWGIKKL